jgi:hypothetical protein
MASSAAATVDQFLAELPPERVELVTTVRDLVNANLPEGYHEAMQYGMVGWSVPHDRYPAGYHTDPSQPLPLAALASQKQYVSLYLMGLYIPGPGDDPTDAETADVRWLRDAWAATGRKLNMGKSCVRFKKLDDVAPDVLGQAIARLPVDEYVERYEASRPKER